MLISVIIPVLNEEVELEKAIPMLRKPVQDEAGQAKIEMEIIVVDGGSTDRTLQLAEAADQRVQCRPGRAVQMHAGAMQARGDVLLFLHVDTLLPDDWTEDLAQAYENPATIWTAFPLRFASQRLVFRVIEVLTRLRFAWNGVPHGDQAMSVRRSAYLASGGFPDVPLMEEYCLASRLKKSAPVQLLKRPILTATRRYDKNGPIRQALRNAILVLLFTLGIPPERLAGHYH